MYHDLIVTMNHRATTVAQIMTQGPMCVTSDTSATDALNLMVSRGFRHLVSIWKSGAVFTLVKVQ